MTIKRRPVCADGIVVRSYFALRGQQSFGSVFKVLMCSFFFQHPFVTQLLTRNLVIELLDVANNPELHTAHTHSMDDNELEVSAAKTSPLVNTRYSSVQYRYRGFFSGVSHECGLLSAWGSGSRQDPVSREAPACGEDPIWRTMWGHPPTHTRTHTNAHTTDNLSGILPSNCRETFHSRRHPDCTSSIQLPDTLTIYMSPVWISGVQFGWGLKWKRTFKSLCLTKPALGLCLY